MKFFMPAATDDGQAERVYEAIAKFNNAIVEAKRIYALKWEHNGMQMSCTVGASLPSYYRTGDEPVLAILDCSNVFKICTPNRGGIRGEPVLAGKGLGTHATYFKNS